MFFRPFIVICGWPFALLHILLPARFPDTIYDIPWQKLCIVSFLSWLGVSVILSIFTYAFTSRRKKLPAASLLLTLLAAFGLAGGCDSRAGSGSDVSVLTSTAKKGNDAYAKALESGIHSGSVVGDFNRTYTNCDNIISYFTSGAQGGSLWNSSVAFYDRYVLRVRVPIKLDDSLTRIVAYGEPAFYLWEVSSFTHENDRLRISREQLAVLTPGQWQTLLSHGGDILTLGIPIKTNALVPGFNDREPGGFEANWRRF
jgi:hypothetical protein